MKFLLRHILPVLAIVWLARVHPLGAVVAVLLCVVRCAFKSGMFSHLFAGRGQTGDLPREGLMFGGVTQGSGRSGLAGLFSCCPLRGAGRPKPASSTAGGIAFLSIRFPVARHGWV